MWLKQLTLVFLTAAAAAAMVISGQKFVTLDEKQVEVPLGSPLILNCNLKTDRYIRFWVTWYFKPISCSSNQSQNLSTKMFNRNAPDFTGVSEAILWNHTSNAMEKNSGCYFCNLTVDIPILAHNASDGTKVVISKYYLYLLKLVPFNLKSAI